MVNTQNFRWSYQEKEVAHTKYSISETRKEEKMRDKQWQDNRQLNILNILQPKKENFQIKNSDNFHISSQNIGTH